MSNTGYQVSGNDLITVFDSSLKTTLTQNQSTGYVCNSTGKDLGNIFTLFSSLSGGGYTGSTGTNCGLVSGGQDIGSLFVNINTTAGLGSGLLTSLPSSSTCKALYACRWVNNSYKGPIFQIKRDQDNVTSTFYMNALGTAIGTGSNGTGTSLTTWLTQSTPASTIAYVLTWYDQSGNGNHATQSTAPYIPTFDTTTNTVNFSSTFMNFSNTLLSAGNNSFTISYNFVSTNLSSTMNYLYNIGQNTNSYDAVAGGMSSTTLNNYFTLYNCYYTPAGNVSTSFLTVTNKYDKTNRYIYYNIPASASTTLATTNLNLVQGTGPSLLGSGGATFGKMSYFTVFNSSLSDSDRSIVESKFSTFGKGVLMTLPSGCQGLYSCKWINNAYTGPIFNIRRSSDSTTSDFYVNYVGIVTTGKNGVGTTLSSWIGAGTAFVVTWYDQSGVGNNATQSTTTNQPTYSTTNNSIDFTGTKYLILPDGTVPYNNTKYTVSFKLATTATAPCVILASGGGGQATKDSNIFRVEASNKFRNWWDSNQVGDWIPSGNLANNTCVLAYNNTANTLTGYYNGTQIGSSSMSVSSRSSTSLNNYIGNGTYYFTGQYLNSQLYSISIFNTTLSSTTDINTLNLI